MTRPALRWLVVAFIALAALAGVTISFFIPRGESYIKDGKVLLNPAQGYFDALITSRGPDEARSEYLRAGQKLSEIQAHELAHVFGVALYDELGLDGIAYCGQEFSNGCFHEFMGEVIAQHGFSVVPDLFQICETISSKASR